MYSKLLYYYDCTKQYNENPYPHILNTYIHAHVYIPQQIIRKWHSSTTTQAHTAVLHPLCSEDTWEGKVPTAVIIDIIHVERAGHVYSPVDQIDTLFTAKCAEPKMQHAMLDTAALHTGHNTSSSH